MPTCSRSSNGSPRLLNRRAKCRTSGRCSSTRISRSRSRRGSPFSRVASSANSGAVRSARRRLSEIGRRVLGGRRRPRSAGGLGASRRPHGARVGTAVGGPATSTGCSRRAPSCSSGAPASARTAGRAAAPPRRGSRRSMGTGSPGHREVLSCTARRARSGRWPGRYLSMAMTADRRGRCRRRPGPRPGWTGGRRRRRRGWRASPSRSRRGARRCPRRWAPRPRCAGRRGSSRRSTVSGASPRGDLAERGAGLVDGQAQVLDGVEVVVHPDREVTGHRPDRGQLGRRGGHPQLQPLRAPSVLREGTPRVDHPSSAPSSPRARPSGRGRPSCRARAGSGGTPGSDPASGQPQRVYPGAVRRQTWRSPRRHGRRPARLPGSRRLVLAGPR